MSLAKLKQIELDILKQFISVCQKLNLNYYILGGTLLGAVRHQGFIPWDDDIDVGMSRKDYEIFLQKAQILLPEPYFLQTYHTDPEYPLNFAKIRNSDTTFIETNVSNRKMNHGIYIDVFPIDFYPDYKLQQLWFDIRLTILHFRMRSEFIIPKQYKATVVKKTLQQILMWAAKLICPSAQNAIEQRERLLRTYTNTSKVANFCGAWGKREIVPVSYFHTCAFLPFEDITVAAPIEYDKYLTHIYGNYMKLPSKEKQTPHHYTHKIDLKNSYKNYLKQ